MRKNLDEISFIRPVLIVMLVMFHAFCPWTGRWLPMEDFVPCKVYSYWGSLNYSFMLESFVMISGYLFAFGLSRGKITDFWSLIKNKFTRLIVPSIVFSALYIAIFRTSTGTWTILYHCLKGNAHMWFLPMLFWCFLGGYLLHKIKLASCWKMIVLLGVALISYVPLPFQFGRSMYYLFFFYGGMVLLKKKEELLKKVVPIHIVVLWIIFLVSLFGANLFYNWAINTFGQMHIILKALLESTKIFFQIIYATLGTLALYLTSLQITKKHAASKFIINIGALCFGIYLFQQFILKLLYYNTNLINGTLMTPWLGFIITLCLSVFLSWLVHLTNFGRKFIG